MNIYSISQNNTGGSFETNDKLCHRLFIEAESVDDAISIAEDLGCYWDGVDSGSDCPCCGDRWYKPDDETKFPMQYGKDVVFQTIEEYAQYLANQYGWTTPDARIFYKNGEIKEIFKSIN